MIWKSRKFWLAVADVVISTVTYFVSKYLGPPVSEDILFLIGAWQPVIGILIASIAYEDAATTKANAA
jgi:hypothetical protein